MKDGQWYADRIIALQEQVRWLKSCLEQIEELGEKARYQSTVAAMYCTASNGLAHLKKMEREE